MRFVALLSLCAVAAATPPPNKIMLFDHFMEKYERKYATEFEKGMRFQIFSQNVDQIYASNSKNLSYRLGITADTDRTFEEWRAEHINGGLKPKKLTATKRAVFAAPKGFSEPDGVDWVSKGGVTSVKNQGTCGSCWTFSASGALEGAMFVAGRKIQDLSEQHILACDTEGDGCGGGSMEQAFEWVEANGLTSLADEPYLCTNANDAGCQAMTCGAACAKHTGESCIFGSCNKVAGSVCSKTGLIHQCSCPDDQCFSDGECSEPSSKPVTLALAVGDVTTYTDVDQTENALEAAVAQQPVSVAIEADQSVFQHYTGGILTNSACGSNLDHGVLAVGYGVDNGQKYWKVKNSWGSTWGDDGFIRIEKGAASEGGECGIRSMASFPTIKKSSASAADVIV